MNEQKISAQSSLARLQLKDFAENYLEKVFYYCLKRTGSSYEAEDLASDIALNILTALTRGTIPVSFSAWVWQIARNRYSKWADAKHRYRESAAGADIGDYEIICEEASAEDALIRREELNLLRRELALLSSDYRDIVVAYYIEDRKIQDIASSAGLSQGTVKSKLFRARKKLKEGMNMAREFGSKSFKPENVTFAAAGSQPSGLPWSAIGRKLPKNILLEASGNPSTAEELSIELGTALPYIEEELELLVAATLLRKIEEKYVTDFFIFDRESQLSIYEAQRKNSRSRSEKLVSIAADSLPLLHSLRIAPEGISDNDLMWWALTYLTDHCITHSDSFHMDLSVKRANGETWGLVGYEETTLPESTTVCHDGNGNEENMFWTYSFSDYGLSQRKIPEYTDVLFLADVIRNRRTISSLSASEQNQWSYLENKYAHVDSSGQITPDVLVIYSQDMQKILSFWASHPLYGSVMDSIENTFQETVDILRKNTNPILHHQLSFCASMQMFDCRMFTVRDAVNSGRLIPPEDPGNSRAAMWLELKN